MRKDNVPDSIDKEKMYWLKQLSGELVKSCFPYDRIRSKIADDGKVCLEVQVPDQLFMKLNQVTNNSDKNLYIILLAGLALLLEKYTGNKDIIITAPIYKQRVEGEFINTVLVIRNRLEEVQTFRELLMQVKNTLAEANRNLNYPIERLLYYLGLSTTSSASKDFPLSETAILLENIHYRKYLEPLNFHLVFSFLRTGEYLKGILEYNPRLYKKETVERIFNHLVSLLEESVNDVNRWIGDIDLLTTGERELLSKLNNTRWKYPQEKAIHQLFAEEVEKWPDRIIVVESAEPMSMTYGELNQKSNQLAVMLREKSVKPGNVVGIMVGPSLEMIIGILALLKAGGTYLPLEPDFPEGRVQYILHDSNTHILLTLTPASRYLGKENIEIINIDDPAVYKDRAVSNLKPLNGPEDNVYAIYTSGTTGKPKGVLVKNESLVNYVTWFSRTAGLTEEDKTLLTSSFVFDLGYTAIYPAILRGCELHIVEREAYLNAEKFLNYVEANQITYLKMTPSLFTIIVNSLDFTAEKLLRIRLVVCGGEAVNLADIETVRSLCPHIRVMNHYGPTEATIGSVAQLIDFEEFDRYRENPTIGSPIDNTFVLILDKNFKQVPLEVTGEICLGGAGLANGYLNNPELTAEKFRRIVISQSSLAIGSFNSPQKANDQYLLSNDRLYRTGDRGRWLTSGNIEFQGRIDQQVKIRGYRVELGEIEEQVNCFHGVRESVVLVRETMENPGVKHLAAYIIPNPEYAYPVHQLLWLKQNKSHLDIRIDIDFNFQHHELPNGMSVFYLNKSETDHMYREIIREQSYIKHGICLKDCTCIFDVGANIGIFSLFVHQQCPDAAVYAFEPIPSAYDILKLNTLLYGIRGKVFQLGISAEEGESEFTYYPNISILSGRYADADDERKAVGNYIYEQQLSGEIEDQLSGEQIRELLEERLSDETVYCAVKSLSQVIKENGIKRIDLLKIVAEKSELDVLKGIKEDDWRKIRQLVVEVYNKDGRLTSIGEILENYGFYVTVEKDSSLGDSEFYHIFATREKTVEESSHVDPPNAGFESREYWCSPEQLISDLKDHVKKNLPDYMVPAYFILLEKLPLTPNGKLDRNALPLPETNANKKYKAPRNKMEKKLVEIWSEVLGGDVSIGIEDNFFEQGGNSLSAVTMVSRIHKELNIKVPLVQVFQTPTVMELSAFIENSPWFRERYSAIQPVEKREYYPLSSAQKRMFTLHQLDPLSTVYNTPRIIPLPGNINLGRLEEDFRRLIYRHESLRTSFHMMKHQPVQRVLEIDEVELEIENYLAAGDTGKREFIIKRFIRPFDLFQAPLLRIGLVETRKGENVLLTDMHHIICDGISNFLLARELMALYRGEELPPLHIQYKDFSQWGNSEKASERIKKQESYWIRQFEDEIPIPDLPTDYPRPAVQNFEGFSVSFEIGEEDTRLLTAMALEEKASLYMVLLALYNILLSKLTGQEDIVIGTVTTGRRYADLENIIGMFINTVALRNYPVAKKTFKGLLKELKHRTLEAFENQDYQFEDLVDKLSLNRDASRNPLFDVVFTFQTDELDDEGFTSGKEKLDWETQEVNNKVALTSKFDLSLDGIKSGGALYFQIEYCTKLFKNETIERFIAYFKKIVSAIVKEPGVKLSQIEVIPGEEKRRLLYGFNETDSTWPGDKTVRQLFEDRVKQNPNRVAIVFEDKKSTYNALNEYSNRLAGLLRRKGVKPNDILGILIKPSLEMVAAMWAVLKAGGAYMPFDHHYPQERIKYLFEESCAKYLLTHNNLLTDIDIELDAQIIDLDNPVINMENGENLENTATLENLAYVIYTSGSSGKPKGVIVEHQNLLGYVNAFYQEFKITSKDTVLQQASFSFDAYVEEVYPVLLKGGKVVIISPEKILDIHFLAEYISKNQVSIISCSPLLLNELDKIDGINTVRLFISGGDVLKGDFIGNLLKQSTVYNTYGPTESTVCVTYYRCINRSQSPIPIGKPISNYRVYILDNNFKLQPIGVGGELCVSGHGVSRGYLNRPELTFEKFTASPYWQGEPMYRTGDQARWLHDGNIDFLGRIDQQVKIRGYRIEPGEIESQLLKKKNIKEAVVVVQHRKTDEKNLESNYLCGYLVSDNKLDISELREYLSKALPGYMIPPCFVEIEEIPLTSNGKIDRNALPAPGLDTGEKYIEPRDEVEKKLANIWSEILGIKKDVISIKQNFFELGGNSLNAALLVSRIYKEMNVKLPMGEVFRAPKIIELARHINESAKDKLFSIESAEKKEYYLMTSAQRGFYTLRQMESESTAYNIPIFTVVEGRLDKDRFKAAFERLISRHESLRTSMEIIEGEAVQRVHENVKFAIEYHESDEKKIPGLVKGFIRPFDLSRAPLMRVGLITIVKARQKYILMIDLHHIISDFLSMHLLEKEFILLYQGKKLPGLKLQYRDYSEWQNSEEGRQLMKQQEAFWLKEFEGELPVLNIPTDFLRPEIQDFSGSRINFEIGKELTDILKELALKQGVTLHILTQAIFNILLSKISGQEDIITAISTTGRRHADLEHIVGVFINTLALRNFPTEEKTFLEFLEEVKVKSLKAYENQGYPFDELVNKLLKTREHGRNPIFDIWFEFRSDLSLLEMRNVMGESRLSFRPYPYDRGITVFDMIWTGSNNGDRLNFTVDYNTHLFERTSIELMIDGYLDLVKKIAREAHVKIKDLECGTFLDNQLSMGMDLEFKF
jgi:amino acid adenylation domain-containing protein/FkbM family methyltransferase